MLFLRRSSTWDIRWKISFYGASRHNKVYFVTRRNGIGHGVLLNFPDTDAAQIDVTDNQGKTYLQVERSGGLSRDSALIESFTRDYVAFSRQNFPCVLVLLLAKKNVMFNLSRPLMIYESMSLSFHHLDFRQASVAMMDPKMEVNGKRASAFLHFQIKTGENLVGTGFKKLAISVLSGYESQPMQAFVDDYLARKNGYLSNLAVMSQ